MLLDSGVEYFFLDIGWKLVLILCYLLILCWLFVEVGVDIVYVCLWLLVWLGLYVICVMFVV